MTQVTSEMNMDTMDSTQPTLAQLNSPPSNENSLLKLELNELDVDFNDYFTNSGSRNVSFGVGYKPAGNPSGASAAPSAHHHSTPVKRSATAAQAIVQQQQFVLSPPQVRSSLVHFPNLVSCLIVVYFRPQLETAMTASSSRQLLLPTSPAGSLLLRPRTSSPPLSPPPPSSASPLCMTSYRTYPRPRRPRPLILQPASPRLTPVRTGRTTPPRCTNF
jgi:hypothetical protein